MLSEDYKSRLKLLAGIITESNEPSNINDNFWKWFNGSKVVDKNGKPAIVHHGTAKKFSKFSFKNAPQKIIWFTSNKTAVEAGEVGAQGKGHVMDLYVSIKNPAGWKEYEKYGLGQLKDLGYDGAILPDPDGTFTGFVFDSNQVKSVKNKGEWDGTNKSIFKEGDVKDQDYLKWKRKNVTLRGMSNGVGEENSAGAMLGDGLYTASLGNKVLAKKFGTVYFAVNARPKKPIVFNDLNKWEIWFQGNLLKPYGYNLNRFSEKTTIEKEIEKLGYDGIEIKGREMVNFSPGDDVMYFKTEQELEQYYLYNVRNTLNGLNSLYEGINVYHGSDSNFDTFDMSKVGSGDGRSLGGWGIYFSDSPDVSKQYITRKGSVKRYDIKSGEYFDLDANMDVYESNKIVGLLKKKGVDDAELEQFQTDYIEYADTVTNRQVYEWLAHVLGGEKNASLFLLNIGYIGNMFRDRTNPNAKNYVLFDSDYISQASEEDNIDDEDQY